MKKIILLSALAIGSLSSCYRPLFRPESVYDPMLSKPATVTANASVLAVGLYNFPSFDLSAAYAPINHLGIKASWRNRFYNNVGSVNNRSYQREMRGSTIEGGLGYFDHYGRQGLFSVYVNFATGNNKDRADYTDIPENRDLLQSRFRSFSVQPAVGMVKNNLSMSGGVKLGMYQFYDIKVNNAYYTQEHYDQISNNLYPMIEPYYVLEAGSRNIRFNLTAGFAIAPGGPDLSENTFTPKLAVGISARFGK